MVSRSALKGYLSRSLKSIKESSLERNFNTAIHSIARNRTSMTDYDLSQMLFIQS